MVEKKKVKRKLRKNRNWLTPLLIGFAIISIFLSFILSFNFFRKIRLDSQKSSEQQKILNPVSSTTFLSFEDKRIAGNSLAKLVPADVDFYLESVEAKSFYQQILVKGILQDESSHWEKYLASPLSIFATLNGDNISWGIISSVRDVDAVQRMIGESRDKSRRDLNATTTFIPPGGISRGEWLAEMVGTNLLLSDDPALIELVRDAENELILNLSLTPRFVKTKIMIDIPVQVWVLRLGDNTGMIEDVLWGKRDLDINSESYIISNSGVYEIRN